jgi:hypothetical protein
VNDWSGGWGGYGNRWGAHWGINGQFQNRVQNLGDVAGSPDTAAETFSVGEISVSATVNVSFLIE